MLHATYLAWTIDFNILFLLIQIAIVQRLNLLETRYGHFFTIVRQIAEKMFT